MSIEAMVKRVQDSAAKHSGHCTFAFSQATNPIAGMIGLSKITEGGICQALSEMWVVHHAAEGSLWNWLYPDGRLSTSALANMAYNFSYGSVKKGSGFKGLSSQDQNSDLWFLQYGIRRRSGIVMKVGNVGVRSLDHGERKKRGSRRGLGRDLGNSLVSGSMVTNLGAGSGTYRMIGIYGDGGHCMCAYVGQDVAFFDPNFGEFWFEKRADFANWWGKAFWTLSGYSSALSDAWELRDYAKAVGPGARRLSGKF
jgi:YopT peptidase